MKMLNNDYYDIALNNLEFIQLCINSKYYNPMVVECQQVVEKLLKSVAQYICTDKRIMKLNNLRRINSAILSKGTDLQLDVSDLVFLKDFYFNVRYPGDNFVVVSESEFIKSLDIMYVVLKAVNKFRSDNNMKINDYKVIYPSHDTSFNSAINKMGN